MIEKLRLYFFRSILHSLFSSHQIHLVHKVMPDNSNHVLFFYHCVRYYQHLPNGFSFNWPMNPQSLNFVVVGATSSIFIISFHHPDVSRVRHCVLGRTHSSFGRREYWTKGPIRRRKKIECLCNLFIFMSKTSRKKTASHDMQLCVSWKQFLSTDLLFTVYFAVNFQTKVEKPLCFLILLLSC